MNKNIKGLFLLTTVLMILLTISAITATQINNDTVIDDAQISSQDIIQNSASNTVSDTDDDNKIIKKNINDNTFTKSDENDGTSGEGGTVSDTTDEEDTRIDTNLFMYTRSGDVINSTIKVSGKLQSNGEEVKGEPITIYVNNNTYTATSGGYGYFTVNHKITTYDDLNVTFVYAGSSVYKGCNNTTVYTVKKPTHIYIYPRSGDSINTTIKVSGKLQYGEDEGIKGEKINITVNDKHYTTTSGGYGYFTVNHEITTYDDLNITFTFAGSKNYYESTNSTVYTVKKPTHIYIYPRSNDVKGTTIKVSGKLQYGEDEGIKGEKINITVNDEHYTATSGGYGYFTVNHTITSYDDLNVTFTFAGDQNYEGSTNSTIYTVKGPETITDETYSYFFNEDGTLIEGTIVEGDEAVFEGTLSNKTFVIIIPVTITTGENQAVFDGCYFNLNGDITVQNVQFTGKTSKALIDATGNINFKNVTFNSITAESQNMINPKAAETNITMENCTVKDFMGGSIVRSTSARIGLNITNSEFTNNNGTFSPIQVNGADWKVNIENSRFMDNKGQNGFIQVMSKQRAVININNSKFERNTAGGKAGVIYSTGNNANITITNSNFTDNGVPEPSTGSSVTNLAGVIDINNINTNLILSNNIMTGSIAANGTDIYLEGINKIYTDAKLIAENASTDKDQYVDLKFKLTDDNGNIMGLSASRFNYSVTLNDEEISFIPDVYYGKIYGFNGIANKTLNATYPGGLYPITITVTVGADKFDSLEIINGQLEVIAPKQTPTITYEILNDKEGKVAVEFTVVDEEGNEITSAPLVLTGDINATTNTDKLYKNSELTEGTYDVNVKFEESEDYLEATLNFTLTVKNPQKIIDELNESLINNQTALEGNITALEQLQAENEALQAQIENLTEALEANQTALAANITALDEANEQIAQLEQNITTLTEALEANKTALAQVQEDLAQANEQIAQLEQNITTLTEAIEANQTALQEAQETITELENNKTALEEQLNETQTALTEAQETITELNNNITTLEKELGETQSALAESEEENANLTAKVAELEAALAANQTALQEAQETIDQLNNNKTALENELNNTNAALTEAQETIIELNNNITTLEKELNETQNELADTQEALDKANESIEELNNVIDALEEELNQTQNELADAQEALNDANEAIEDLEYKVSELELALNIAEKALDKAIDAITELNQPKATSISIDPITNAKYGDEINITGLLVNDDAIGLSNQPVTITLNGEEIEVTTRNGEFTYTTTADIIGENKITVTYAGNDKYVESEATTTFTVAKANSTIELTELEAVQKGDVLTISGVLYDHNNNTLSNKVVRLLVNNGRKTVKTNKMGEFSFDYTTTKVGDLTVTATFEGNDYYEATTAESTFNVEALSTVIKMDDLNQVIKGTEATISGTLTDEKGNVIANAQIKLSINGSPKTLKTDSEGRFTHTYTFAKVGENTITATYAGNPNHEATNAEIRVNVTKTEATITLAPIEDVTVGSMASISGTLTYADGNPIANAQVKLNINGSPKTLKTDENGAFVHTFKMTKEGTNNITAVFNGNNDYETTEATTTVEVIKAE